MINAGADVNYQLENGATALMLAAQLGHLGAVHTLLAANANPNLKASNGDVPGGIADLTAALSIRESVIDLNNRAYAYVSTRDYARALADFDRAAVVAPNSHQYDNSRCWYRIMANTQLDVARAACDRGILGDRKRRQNRRRFDYFSSCGHLSWCRDW